WGVVGGLGFPIGQAFQAASASDSAGFQEAMPILWGINHWNMMECAFGFVAGGVLGFGVWLHRKRIDESESDESITLPLTWEVCLVVGYLYMMLVAWFLEETQFGRFYEYGLVMAIIPVIGVMGGRYWPYLYALPIVAMPIAGKTFRAVSLGTSTNPPLVPTDIGWLMIVTFPLLILTIIALHCAKPDNVRISSRQFGAWGLLATSTCYFLFNFTFLSFPWSWLKEWQMQSTSGMIYIIAWVVLSLAAYLVLLKSKASKHF
ncbi:MAG: hypothetical protein KDA65_10045, partial [Planctomycetaceae bacterium]|nr:hypothetical protein [Planctomycetaceae bacterium]